MNRKYIYICIFFFVVISFCIYRVAMKTRKVNINRKKYELSQSIQRMADQSKNSCTLPYPVFYINMDRNPERKKYVETQLKNIGARYMRIRGLNGYTIMDKSKDTVDGINFINKYSSLSKSEIGCVLSHLLAIYTAYIMGVDIAMICEDDIVFTTCPLIPNLEKVVQQAPKDWEILQLCPNIQDRSRYRKYKTKPGIQYIRRYPEDDFRCCACYIVNRKGMENILRHAKPEGTFLLVPKDVKGQAYPWSGEADVFIYDLAVTYTILPSLFLVNNSDLESTIHPDHTPGHIDASMIAMENLKDLVV